MTAKMLLALRLLAEHGDGDVTYGATELAFDVPSINLRTALALDKLGYVLAFEQSEWHSLWGSIELQPKGAQLVAELKGGSSGE